MESGNLSDKLIENITALYFELEYQLTFCKTISKFSPLHSFTAGTGNAMGAVHRIMSEARVLEKLILDKHGEINLAQIKTLLNTTVVVYWLEDGNNNTKLQDIYKDTRAKICDELEREVVNLKSILLKIGYNTQVTLRPVEEVIDKNER